MTDLMGLRYNKINYFWVLGSVLIMLKIKRLLRLDILEPYWLRSSGGVISEPHFKINARLLFPFFKT